VDAILATRTTCEAGANPTIVSYNASAVKNYNAMSSQARFENKNDFVSFEKTLYPTTTLPLLLKF
jgi:hypothetical protein